MKKPWAFLSFAIIALLLVPVFAEANSGDFSGGVAIGTSYAGINTAPTNGLIVQGNVGIGTSTAASALQVAGNTNTTTLQLNGSNVPLPAGARLTLSSSTPVMTADVAAATTVYYTDYSSDLIPIYNGSNWVEQPLGGQILLALDSNAAHTGYQASGNNYDLFVGLNGGTLELCTGPAWSSNTARGTGVGTTQIQMINGIWTNQNSMTCRFGNVSGNTFTCAANQCTFVGTMRATANGQTALHCQAFASGGGSAVVGISNAYNRIPITCENQDTANNLTYNSNTTWQAFHNSAANSVAWVDSLQQANPTIFISAVAGNNTAGDGCQLGAILNSTTNIPASNFAVWNQSATGTLQNNYTALAGQWATYPLLGYNYYQLMWVANVGGTCTYSLVYSAVINISITY